MAYGQNQNWLRYLLTWMCLKLLVLKCHIWIVTVNCYCAVLMWLVLYVLCNTLGKSS